MNKNCVGKTNRHAALTRSGQNEFTLTADRVPAKSWSGKTEEWRDESKDLCAEVDDFITRLCGRYTYVYSHPFLDDLSKKDPIFCHVTCDFAENSVSF